MVVGRTAGRVTDSYVYMYVYVLAILTVCDPGASIHCHKLNMYYGSLVICVSYKRDAPPSDNFRILS